jgi:hypothetical protein
VGPQGATGPPYGTYYSGTSKPVFNQTPDDAGLTPAGWIIVNISGTDYYLPAWT